jgi:hypothetical protein
MIVGQLREPPGQCGESVPFVQLRPARLLGVFRIVGQKCRIAPRLAPNHRNASKTWAANHDLNGELPPLRGLFPRLAHDHG